MNDGLKDKYRQTLIDILAANPRVERVVLFGSRATGAFRPASDIDLALYGDELTLSDLARLRTRIEETSIPQQVDLVLVKEIDNPKLLAHINEDGVEWFWREENFVGKDGGVGNKWRYLPFTEAVEVNPSIPLKRGEMYPFVDMKAVESSSRGASESEFREFKSGGARFMPFDTLMARITPCLENGKIARYIPSEGIDGPAFGSTEFIVIRGREGITDNAYAYYLTKWKKFRQFAISQMTGSSGRQRVPADSLAKFLAPVPGSLSKQRAIAHILGTLDDKIELNRQMNRTLEAMAQALFKSWFIDFDPVVLNALRAGNPVPEKFAQRAAHYRRLLNSPSPSGRGVGVREQKIQKLPPDILEFARNLRTNQTDAEQLLWQLLRGRRFLGLKFRRQHPVKPYVLDFFCHEMKLAVEVDGGQHNEAEHRCKDAQRTAYLADQGITVVRYWADTVLKDTSAVLQDLYEKVQQLKSASRTPSPLTPLPEGEGNWPFSEDILHLFPDRFQNSELGPLPEGWIVGMLSDIAEAPRRSVKPADVSENTPYIGLEHMPRRSISLSDWGGAGKVSSGKFRFKRGEFLFGKLRPYFHKVGVAAVDGICSTDIVVIKPKYKELAMFILTVISSDSFIEYTNAGSSGTRMPRTSWKVMGAYNLCIPKLDTTQIYQLLARPMIDKIIDNIHQSRTLASLRDTLLPKLISGELRVPDAEKLLEEAL